MTTATKSSPAKFVAPAPLTDLVGMRIKKMNCHAGLILHGLAVSGLHHKDNDCDMVITPVGVYVKLKELVRRPAADLLVPWANIYYVELFHESA